MPAKRGRKQSVSSAAPGSRPETRTQVSAGGVPFRVTESGVEVALISVGKPPRWQLPKGIVEPGEKPEVTAVREAREETGLDAELVGELERIEYWYQSTDAGVRVRFHKFVHFFLLAVRGGDVARHDHEVMEARWFPIEEGARRLAFKNEARVLESAAAMIERARRDS
jgi:8-oxo-dGTP pyrophosphatase MutT (NUDIX family)